MGLSEREAYKILELPQGASQDDVRAAYKKLAMQWHPDRHKYSSDEAEEATRKFQEISSAYKRLTNYEPEHDDGVTTFMSTTEMFEMFSHIFFATRVQNRHVFADDSSSDEFSSDEDGNSDSDEFSIKNNKNPTKVKSNKGEFKTNKMREEEARKNAEELIAEEERELRLKEKKRAKKKRQREKRRDQKIAEKQGEGGSGEAQRGEGDGGDYSDETPRDDYGKEGEEEAASPLPAAAPATDKKSKGKPEKENPGHQSSSRKENGGGSGETPPKKAHGSARPQKPGAGDAKPQEERSREPPLRHQNSTSSSNSASADKEKSSSRGHAASKAKPTKPKASKKEQRAQVKYSSSESEDESSSVEKESKEADGGPDNSELDTNSAFFAKAAAIASKKTAPASGKKASASVGAKKGAANSAASSKAGGNGAPASKKAGGGKPEATQPTSKSHQEPEELDPDILKSRQIAVRGNEEANMGHYKPAIDLFTEAIKLDANDYRFYGNRSYCYDRIGQYHSALLDANSALAIYKDWPKGYFRKGRALAGLKKYIEAEKAFDQVLKLDRQCEEAIQELYQVRINRLVDMGFPRAKCEKVLKGCEGGIQSALEELLTGALADSSLEEVYVSDEEDTLGQQDSVKTDSCNPEGLSSVWVGNVSSSLTEEDMNELFSTCGEIESVRMLPERYCCFINFAHKDSATKAMQDLQGKGIGGTHLLIKFPDRPRTNGFRPNYNNPPPSSSSSDSYTSHSQNQTNYSSNYSPKPRASYEDECYFWRTSGCTYGDNCKFKHVPENKAIDKKPWHK